MIMIKNLLDSCGMFVSKILFLQKRGFPMFMCAHALWWCALELSRKFGADRAPGRRFDFWNESRITVCTSRSETAFSRPFDCAFFVLIKSLTEHACSANVFILKVGRSQGDHFSRSGLIARQLERAQHGAEKGARVAGRPTFAVLR